MTDRRDRQLALMRGRAIARIRAGGELAPAEEHQREDEPDRMPIGLRLVIISFVLQLLVAAVMAIVVLN